MIPIAPHCTYNFLDKNNFYSDADMQTTCGTLIPHCLRNRK